MDKPFPAYKGDDPYVFVCYAHDDEDVVYPEMAWLHEQGINLYPNNDPTLAVPYWQSAIEDRSELVLLFLVPQYDRLVKYPAYREMYSLPGISEYVRAFTRNKLKNAQCDFVGEI